METLIDLGIVIFIPFMVYRGFRRGTVYSLMTYLVVFLSFSCAVFLSENFSEQVGRLIQPVVKTKIVAALEDGLKFENIIIERPSSAQNEEETSEETTEETTEEVTPPFAQPDYLTITRALQVLSNSYAVSDWKGFVDHAQSKLLFTSVDFTGSVTTEISSVMAQEMARVGILAITFTMLFSLWLLLMRRFKITFKGDTQKMDGYAGAVLGFMVGMLLVFVFAWITRYTLISSTGVSRTLFYEGFARFTPLDSLAEKFKVLLDL